MNDWVSVVVAWLPFLVLIGVWLYFSRYHGMQARGSSTGATLIDLYEQQVAETRRMNANLERIAVSLEKREGGALGGAD
jgi:ATP-dependent Zn protease